MIPNFSEGLLPVGVHQATLGEVRSQLGFTIERMQLIDGLEEAIQYLRKAGCKTIYVGGSFVTDKPVPNDIDCCYDLDGIDTRKLDAVFFDFGNKRENQKKKFGCEFFPASSVASQNPLKLYKDFFQSDRNGVPKGILEIKL